MSTTSNAILTFRRNSGIIQANTDLFDFYVFAAKGTPWPNDYSPPSVDTSSYTTDYQISNEILFGKALQQSDISPVATRYDWVSGTVYTMYTHNDGNIFSENFYVLTSEAGAYHVFKCINNNNGSPSTHRPSISETSATDQLYQTSDGYTWKYMYSIDSTTYNKFATPSYIPISSNAAVVGNAVSGAICALTINSTGNPYYSCTNGYFTDISVNGNNYIYDLQGSDTTVLTVSSNTFTIGETVTQLYSGVVANGIVQSFATSNTSGTLTLKSVSGIFSTQNTVTGTTSHSVASVSSVSNPSISSNANFYTGSSIYILSGTGAGQISTIANYQVIGNARRVILSTPFSTLPDFTSKYLVTPQVTIKGDGVGAAAYSVIDSVTNAFKYAQIINVGQGYSYANVTITGNSGYNANTSNNVTLSAVISPKGGHGSDPVSELNPVGVSFTTAFSETENGTIPGSNTTYRRVGIITDPVFSNVTLTFTYSILPLFPSNEDVIVTGSISNSVGNVIDSSVGSNTVSLTNVSGLFVSGDMLTAAYANGLPIVTSNNIVEVVQVAGQATTFDNRTLLTCPTSTLIGSAFAVNEKVVQVVSNTDVAYGYVQGITTSGNNTIIALSETLGTFQVSNTTSGSYKYLYDDATRLKLIQINQVDRSDLIQYSGNILYVENMIPVTRSDSQSESVNIITTFV